jgi:hypothetical protein
MPELNTILVQIDSGAIALPEFQRGYVWGREQVRRLMRSLYKNYPVGELLMWETHATTTDTRNDSGVHVGVVRLLLDGQQRITSLYGIIRGTPPPFFDGNKNAFTGLYFNLETEEFKFYLSKQMDKNPVWINVTELMINGAGRFASRIYRDERLNHDADTFLERLNRIDSIKNRNFHIEEITGADRTLDEVVEVFNEVNSGGKKLSKADLALAKVCASWSQARDEMKKRLTKWDGFGYYFKLDWLMRCITTTYTGEASFDKLENISAQTFQKVLQTTEKHVDTALHLIGGRLGLDYDRVLGSRGSIPILTRYIEQRGGRINDPKERDQLLYWYIHTFLWGRYTGSVESTLASDLNILKEYPQNSLDKLIEALRTNRGDLNLKEIDFAGSNVSNRFYPLLYMLTRVGGAKDWGTGVDLNAHSLGRYSYLQVHHIFPKKRLSDRKVNSTQINAVANFTFLTQDTNIVISDRDPAQYLAEYADRNPEAIASHWIPMDRNLWKLENYTDFLAERRKLLAKAANDFLNSLVKGSLPDSKDGVFEFTEKPIVYGSIDSEQERNILEELKYWVVQQGLSPDGQIGFELVDKKTNNLIAMLDLAWENDLQNRNENPVAVILEDEEVLKIANQHGYRCFTDADEFKDYVRREVLQLTEVDE